MEFLSSTHFVFRLFVLVGTREGWNGSQFQALHPFFLSTASPLPLQLWIACYTENICKAVPSFGKFCSCCCLPRLPQLACSILVTWEGPYSEALYILSVTHLHDEPSKLDNDRPSESELLQSISSFFPSFFTCFCNDWEGQSPSQWKPMTQHAKGPSPLPLCQHHKSLGIRTVALALSFG